MVKLVISFAKHFFSINEIDLIYDNARIYSVFRSDETFIHIGSVFQNVVCKQHEFKGLCLMNVPSSFTSNHIWVNEYPNTIEFKE